MQGAKKIERFISNLGYCTRSGFRRFAKDNRLTVKGLPPKSGTTMALPEDIMINGRPIPYTNDLYIALHKPRGYVTSRARDAETKIIYDLLPDTFIKRRPTLSAAGRLDKWASGLLVLSQNGDFIQRLTFPKKKHGAFGKVYHLQLQNPLTGNEAAIFASGQLMLRSEETALRPAKFEVIDREERLVKITLFEGRYHQLRRMLAAIGNKAISIHRVQTGPIEIGDLKAGHWRELSPEEIKAVWNS